MGHGLGICWWWETSARGTWTQLVQFPPNQAMMGVLFNIQENWCFVRLSTEALNKVSPNAGTHL